MSRPENRVPDKSGLKSSDRPTITTRNLSCGYHRKAILTGVDLEVRTGEVLCLLLSRRQMARHIAYVPQLHEPPFAFSVFDVALTGCVSRLGLLDSPSRADRERTEEVLERLGIAHLAARPFTELSGGEQQMTLIARALVQDGRILVMDEPAAALDLRNQTTVLRCVRDLADERRGVVMTSHNPDHAFLVATRAPVTAGSSPARSTRSSPRAISGQPMGPRSESSRSLAPMAVRYAPVRPPSRPREGSSPHSFPLSS